MLIVKETNQIVAECPSNTMINRKVLFEWTEPSLVSSQYVPRIGECISYNNNKKVRVVDVEYSSPLGGNCLDDVILYVEPKKISCDFYRYIKAFSHEFDYMKSKDDPTRVENYRDFSVAFPETEAEWLRDLEDLNNGVRDPERRNVKRSL